MRRPARIYDLRATFISNALAAGVSIFEIARIAGTSVRMIEKHYGALLDGAGAGIVGRLDGFDAAVTTRLRRARERDEKKLVRARPKLREAERLLGQAEHARPVCGQERWTPDEDVLDLMREIVGLAVLGKECVRLRRPLDRWAQELWLYEHGYKQSPE